MFSLNSKVIFKSTNKMMENCMIRNECHLTIPDNFFHPQIHRVQEVVCKVLLFLLLWQEFEDLSSLYHCVLFFLHGGRFELVLQPKCELSTGFFLMLLNVNQFIPSAGMVLYSSPLPEPGLGNLKLTPNSPKFCDFLI